MPLSYNPALAIGDVLGFDGVSRAQALSNRLMICGSWPWIGDAGAPPQTSFMLGLPHQTRSLWQWTDGSDIWSLVLQLYQIEL